MKKEDIDKIIALRNLIIEYHGELDGRGAPATAVVKQATVAYNYTMLIRNIDNILRKYVEIV